MHSFYSFLPQTDYTPLQDFARGNFRSNYAKKMHQERDMEGNGAELFCRIAFEQPFTAQHSLRTLKVALRIAEYLGIVTEKELKYLTWGVLLHDFGKLFLPVVLLLKTDELTLEEYESVTTHTKLGYLALKDQFPQQVLEVILYHHERCDGTGYPHGYSISKIPFLAKICTVAEAYATMTETISYHKSISPDQAADEIFWNSGSQFDPKVVTAFLRSFDTWEKRDDLL